MPPRWKGRNRGSSCTRHANRPTRQVSNIAQSILSELDRARGTTITLRLDIESAMNNPSRHFSNDCVCGGIAHYFAALNGQFCGDSMASSGASLPTRIDKED
jgi:hypothetical protein